MTPRDWNEMKKLLADVAKGNDVQEVLKNVSGEGTERLITYNNVGICTAYNTKQTFTVFELIGSGKLHWLTAYALISKSSSAGYNLVATYTYAQFKLTIDGKVILAGDSSLSETDASLTNHFTIGNPKFLVPSSTGGAMVYPKGTHEITGSHYELSENAYSNTSGVLRVNHFLANYLQFNESVKLEITTRYKTSNGSESLGSKVASCSVGYTLDE